MTTAASHSPVPGAGTLAAETVILATSLCGSLAGTAASAWGDARGVVTQAAHLGNRAAAARDANAAAYSRARQELRVPSGSRTGQDGMLSAALLASADTLLTIATVAADTAELAAQIAANVTADLRPDALGAAEIAAGATAAVTELVGVNLAVGEDDPRREHATALLTGARASVDTARDSLLD